MHILPLAAGGVVAGMIMIAGEALLNLWLLADEWARLFSRLGLPQPTAAVAAQGVLKLLLLGILTVWLTTALKPVRMFPLPPAIAAGLVVWLLVWAWVQWGMLLAGYVSPTIAAATVAWGFIELPLAVWVGTWVHRRLTHPAS